MALDYTGYYELIEKMTADFRADFACNRVTFGDITQFDLTKETITPCAHLIPNSFSMASLTTVVSFQIFCYDLVASIKLTEEDVIDTAEGFTNEQDCLDTCFGILHRVLAKYADRTVRLESSFAKLSGDPSFEPVLSEGNSGVAGWLGSVTFIFNPHVDKCTS